MTTQQIFDTMTKTAKVCEVCSSRLYYNGKDGAHYCPECDWQFVQQYADDAPASAYDEERPHPTTDYTASSLYAGGWRHDDKDELIKEYELTQEQADSLCLELASIAYDEARLNHGTVELNGNVYALTQEPYLCGGSYPMHLTVLHDWFEALSIDADGNRYEAVWRPAEGWDPADDDEDYACDWPWPDEIKAL